MLTLLMTVIISYFVTTEQNQSAEVNFGFILLMRLAGQGHDAQFTDGETEAAEVRSLPVATQWVQGCWDQSSCVQPARLSTMSPPGPAASGVGASLPLASPSLQGIAHLGGYSHHSGIQ